MRPRLNLLTRVAFWGAALVASVFAVLPRLPSLPVDPSDKIKHIVAFAVLGILGTLGYPRAGPIRLLLGLAAFGAIIEIVQLVPALQRDGDILDLCADILAASAAIVATRFVMRHTRQERT